MRLMFWMAPHAATAINARNQILAMPVFAPVPIPSSVQRLINVITRELATQYPEAAPTQQKQMAPLAMTATNVR